jgi:hypothetical protein
MAAASREWVFDSYLDAPEVLFCVKELAQFDLGRIAVRAVVGVRLQGVASTYLMRAPQGCSQED